MSNLGALDMALDDVISQKRTNNKRSGNNNTAGRRGGTSRGGINKKGSSGSRSLPYNGASRPVRNTRVANPNNRASNSLVVANLHFNVTEKDLYDLFGQIGQLKRAFLHIGPNGKSAGIADVVFSRSEDAERARNTYNNVELDGRPMRITSASIVSVVANGPRNNSPRRVGNVRGANNGRRDNTSNGGGRRGGSNKKESRPTPSQHDLDAEMDNYMGNNEDIQMN